ncbi:methyl-accepting chemotaxis protein [Trichothermofontia sichuanensis B231]|uniref:methyl-accepting chemotaxis protein n=1 Tax=Trichothermofontia sichuanensis TaxID=3045816 RepID=UPI0022476AFC|nr:methyl-accepting chemotaxis protein [Trichothermofontia sichuanensis]UZQ52859.1 methyl-accepting chemotaxis protein [Trichothermofontia sichuanensis B231]
MSQRNQFKLRQLIVVGYAVPVIALFSAAAIALISVNRVKASSAAVAHSSEVLDRINRITVDLNVVSRTTRGYLLQPNPTSLANFNKAKTSYQESFSTLQRLVTDTAQKENLQTIKPLADELITLDENLIRMVQEGKLEAAIQAWRQQNGQAQADAVVQALQTMNDYERDLVAASQTQEREALKALQRSLIWASAISLVASGVIGTLVIRRASQQLNQAAAMIASSTMEIAASIEEQERSSSHQAASVNQTSTTMDELGASSRQSAQQAEAAANGAQQALALADNGTQAVERTITGMATLKRKVSAIAEQILRLSEQTSQIGSISGLVSDLANQTNMLALNAAVEAVRAGEHGKGFSVVAAEIRKLADESRRSAERISDLVTDIQNAINATVMATDEGTKTVDEGVRIAQQTSDAFAGVASAVNNVVLNNQQISLNIKQQAIAIQQVVDAMNALNAAAQETTNGISQIRMGIQRLNDTAQNLKALV